MNAHERVVTLPDELVAATKDDKVRQITVRGRLANVPSFRLAPGQTLRGENDQAAVLFAGVDGQRQFHVLKPCLTKGGRQ